MAYQENQSGVYTLTNTINGRKYYGRSADINRRWTDHVRGLNTNRHGNKFLQADWDEYGEEAFKFEVYRHTADEEFAEFLEWKLIRDDPACYNILRSEPPKERQAKENVVRLEDSVTPVTLTKRGLIWHMRKMVDGKIFSRSTKTTDRTRAELIAKAWVDELMNQNCLTTAKQ